MAKKKPCDMCGEDWSSDYIDHSNGYCLWAEGYPFNNFIAVIAQANDEYGEMIEDRLEIPMNYCPKCGRKLTE